MVRQFPAGGQLVHRGWPHPQVLAGAVGRAGCAPLPQLRCQQPQRVSGEGGAGAGAFPLSAFQRAPFGGRHGDTGMAVGGAGDLQQAEPGTELVAGAGLDQRVDRVERAAAAPGRSRP